MEMRRKRFLSLLYKNQMYLDIKSGRRADFDAKDYWHNKEIDRIFTKARKLAWASIKDDPRIAKVVEEQRLEKLRQVDKRQTTANILNIYK